MKGLIVAFHTNDLLYCGEARRMKASADRFGLTVHLEEVASSSWLEIVRSKVKFLIAKRRDLQGPLLYVDVDAIFHADPWLSVGEINADVAFALLLDNKARSGTIYLADTQGARNFLEDWQGRLHKAPEAWDQHPLTDIAQDSATGKDIGYCWRNLPPGLCSIFDRPHLLDIGVVPVIEHLQASRELTAPSSEKCQRRRERVREIDKLETVQELISRFEPQTILDYGCGQGALGRELGRPIAEYDPAIKGKEALPDPADLVVCTDVIEHIEPELIEAILDHLQSLTRKCLFAVISTCPANKLLADGRNAHLIVEPWEWWKKKVSVRFRIVEQVVEPTQVKLILAPLGRFTSLYRRISARL